MSAERTLDLDELILSYLLGRIDEPELAALDACLRESPAARDRFAKLSAQEVDLRDAVMMAADRRTVKMPARRTWLAWAAPLAAAASILFVFGLYRLQRPGTATGTGPAVALGVQVPVVREADAGASLKRGSSTLLVQPGMQLAKGDQILLKGSKGRAVIGWGAEKTALKLEGDGAILRMDSAPGEAKALYLAKGQMSAQVAPQPAGQPMLLMTPSARATVVGTEFLLRTAAESTDLEVTSGEIELQSSKGAVTRVAAGKAALVEASSGVISVMGQMMQTWEFDNGFADWQVYTEDDERYVRPATPAMTNAVKLVETTRDGRKIKCLEIDGTAVPGRWIHVRTLELFNLKGASSLIEYMPTRAIPGAEVNLGMVVDAEAVEQKILLQRPSNVGMNRWYSTRSDYQFGVMPDGRPFARASNYLQGQSFHAKNSIFDKGIPMAHSVKCSVRNIKILVDRVTVREIDRKVLPPADRM